MRGVHHDRELHLLCEMKNIIAVLIVNSKNPINLLLIRDRVQHRYDSDEFMSCDNHR